MQETCLKLVRPHGGEASLVIQLRRLPSRGSIIAVDRMVRWEEIQSLISSPPQ
jgi:hypothetical protein